MQAWFAQIDVFKNVADKLKTDYRFLMALSAQETTWGSALSFRVKNNLFGVSFKERPLKYSSYQESADAWIKTFGKDVSGTSSIDDFVEGLKSSGPYEKPYNSVNSNYFSELRQRYDDLFRRAAYCGLNILGSTAAGL